MKFASFKHHGTSSWDAVHDGVVFDLGKPSPSLKKAIATGILPATAAGLDPAKRISTSDVWWLPVMGDPDKILCIGLNYEKHRNETGRSEVRHPTIFTRFANTQIGQ